MESRIATVTPTRGDRKELFDFCRKQIDKQTLQPDNKYYMAFDPTDNHVDLTKRVRMGFELAKKDGMDWVVIIEDDDLYKTNHIETLSAYFKTHDFVGYSNSLYYNLRNKTYGNFTHPNRSSLFCMACKVAAMESFKWPPDNTVFLDIKICNWIRQKNKRFKLLKENPNIGIKHGIGKVGGKGHRLTMRGNDSDLSFLKSHTDEESFLFYTDLMKRL